MRLVAAVAAKDLAYPAAVEAGDVLTLDLLGAFGFASIGVGAGAKAQLVHLADHLLHAILCLGLTLGQQVEVADFGADEEHGGGILASCDTGTTAYAGGSIHALVGLMLGNENTVGIGHTTSGGADVATGLDNLVEGGAVYDEVADDREGFGPPRFYPDFIAIVEMAHVQLAGGDAIIVAVRATVDIKAAHTTNTLAAVVVETHRQGDMVVDELLVELVEHLEEGAFGRDIIYFVRLETPLGLGIFLTPDMECEFHIFSASPPAPLHVEGGVGTMAVGFFIGYTFLLSFYTSSP